MASTKISELTAAAALDGTELVPVVQSSATVQSTIAAINTWISSLAAATTSTATGSGDETATIQADLDAMTSGGLYVMPPGTFTITDEVTVDYAITICGSGRGNTVISATTLGTTKAAFKATVDNVFFCDLTIKGPSAAAYVAEENGILFYGTSGTPRSHGGVRNVETYDLGGAGVRVEYYHDVKLTDNYLHDLGYIGAECVSSNNFSAIGNTIETLTPGTSSLTYGVTVYHEVDETVSKRFAISSNTISDIALGTAVNIRAATDGTVVGNAITSCNGGVYVDVSVDTLPVASSRITISGNTIDGTGLGATTVTDAVSVEGVDATDPAISIAVVSNAISFMGTRSRGAMYFNYTEKTICNSNTLDDPNDQGIEFKNGNLNFTCVGNVVDKVGTSTASSRGIYVEGAAQTGLISSNTSVADPSRACIGVGTPAQTGISIIDNITVTASSTFHIVSFDKAGSGTYLEYSGVVNPPSLADGAISLTVTGATGVLLGDRVDASFSLDLQGVIFTAYVNASNQVTLAFQNETGGVIDLAQGTAYFRVTRP